MQQRTLAELMSLAGLDSVFDCWLSRDYPGRRVIRVKDGYQALYFNLSDYGVVGLVEDKSSYYYLKPRATNDRTQANPTETADPAAGKCGAVLGAGSEAQTQSPQDD